MKQANPGQAALPTRLLNEVSRNLDGLWKKVDFFRARIEHERGKWDPHVFLPFNDWFRFLRQEFPALATLRFIRQSVENLSALAAWRPTQDIVRFEKDLYNSLTRTSLSGNIPSDVIARLPAWSIYVDTPGITLFNHEYEGFFASLDICNEPGLVLLALNFIDSSLDSRHVMIPLGEWSLEKAIAQARADFDRGWKTAGQDGPPALGPEHDEAIARALNLVIYACSDGFIEPGASPILSSGAIRPIGKKTHGVRRFFPPDKPRLRILGGEFAEELKKYMGRHEKHSGKGHAAPRPHLRRAHWHGYWHGPKKGAENAREFRLKWMSPIPVGWSDEEPDDENSP